MRTLTKRTLLFIVFALTLALRLRIAFDTPTFTNDAYFAIRQVESILENGLPLFYDDLSFGGRTLVFAPLYYYVLAIFSKAFFFLETTAVLKISSNIIASTLVFFVYLAAREISKRESSAILASFISGAIPAYIAETTNTLSPLGLLMPLMFLSSYFFIKLHKDKSYAPHFLITYAIMLVTSPYTLLLLTALLIYLIVIYAEHLKFSRAENEVILFVLFFTIWSYLILFKKAILLHGAGIVYQNIPLLILSRYFQDISIVNGIVFIGAVPLLTGIYIVFRQFFIERKRSMFMLVSFAISVLLLLWFKLIQLRTGLLIGGIVLAILFSEFHRISLSALKKTHFFGLRHAVALVLVIIIAATSYAPSYVYGLRENQNTLSEEETEALRWLKEETPEDAVIVSIAEEGHLINFISDRRNVLDPNFLMVDDARQRVQDVNEIFTTPSKIQAIRLMSKYDARYIFFSKAAKETYHLETLKYLDNDCFERIYDNYGQFQIYELRCTLR